MSEGAQGNLDEPSTALDCVIYYICGYVIQYLGKHIVCSQCMVDVESVGTNCPEAYLTIEREFREGSLRQPSWKIFSTFRSIEQQVSVTLDANELCGDIFWNLIEVLEICSVMKLGCQQHQETFTSELLKCYITLRMSFFVKDVCRRLSAPERIAPARRKAKLM